MDINGTAALVTGGASGLGLATAERLAAAGAQVTILDLPSSQGKAVAERLGAAVSFAAADVTDPAAVGAALSGIARRGHALRIVVNCAGIGTPAKVVGKKGPFPLDLFRQTVTVNLHRHVQRDPAGGRAHADPGPGRRGARRHRQHRVGRRLRRPDRPGRLLRVQGRHRRHDAADRARAGREPDPASTRSRPACSRRRCWRRCRRRSRSRSAAQVPHPRRLGAPAEYAQLVEAIVTNPMLNGETIRLDGSIRMAAR